MLFSCCPSCLPPGLSRPLCLLCSSGTALWAEGPRAQGGCHTALTAQTYLFYSFKTKKTQLGQADKGQTKWTTVKVAVGTLNEGLGSTGTWIRESKMISLPPLQQCGQHSAGASCFAPQALLRAIGWPSHQMPSCWLRQGLPSARSLMNYWFSSYLMFQDIVVAVNRQVTVFLQKLGSKAVTCLSKWWILSCLSLKELLHSVLQVVSCLVLTLKSESRSSWCQHLIRNTGRGNNSKRVSPCSDLGTYNT